ncbi:MAG: hypothetical protein WBM34_13765 [Woeseiaceae bacterium]
MSASKVTIAMRCIYAFIQENFRSATAASRKTHFDAPGRAVLNGYAIHDIP